VRRQVEWDVGSATCDTADLSTVKREEADGVTVPGAANSDLRGVEVGEKQETTRLAHLREHAHELAGVLELEHLHAMVGRVRQRL
jgi:hypothetical protein